MKIALLDLNHTSRGVQNNTVPLGLGLISRYLRRTVDHQFDIKIFKDAEKALRNMTGWTPDILGISQYVWNSELNLYAAQLIKEKNPSCLVVAGGPNLDLSASRKVEFFRKYPFIDICISYDGEIPFAELAKRLISGSNVADICRNPVPGSYSLDPGTSRLIELSEKPPRLDSLDVFGTIYTDGSFDTFLNDGFHPFLQTHRGCPFTCTFCHTSDIYYSKMIFLSPDIFKQDMEYLGRFFSGRHDVILYLANTNMGLFDEDFVIANIIREIQKRYDWPRIINVNSGKDPHKLLEILSIIKFKPCIALQTLTPTVLKNIGRRNIPFQDFVYFQNQIALKIGENSSTELILCLPGETRETFLKTLKAVLNSGVSDVVIYTLMDLSGTRLSSQEYADRYGYLVNYRVVPRQFSIIDGKKIIDTERVIVGTNTMSFESYLELRGLSFTIASFFSSFELIPIKRLLIEYEIDIAEWVFAIHRRLSEFPSIAFYYEEFMRATKEELFPTYDALLKFFDIPENFQTLLSGSYGDNLLRKYKHLVIFNTYRSMLDLAISAATNLLSKRIGEKRAVDLLNNLKIYLLSRDVREIFGVSGFIRSKRFCLKYDVPKWVFSTERHLSLEDLCGTYIYSVDFDVEIEKRVNAYLQMNKNDELSLQILYRDGIIKNLWPKWTLQSDRSEKSLE